MDNDADLLHRLLASDNSTRGRTVLTILYLCVLGLCCLTPILYYLRIRYDHGHLTRLRALDATRIMTALQDHREESQAVRRKYVEERRARIVQLMAPVRMIVKEHQLRQIDASELSQPAEQEPQLAPPRADVEAAAAPAASPYDDYDDEEQWQVQVPAPGLHHHAAGSTTHNDVPWRWAPAMCTICLCGYAAGSAVVWSSNEACDHVFHVDCIEKWILKQREGPLCPCCRRDFIIDPFDVNPDYAVSDEEAGGSGGGTHHETITAPPGSNATDRPPLDVTVELSSDDDDGPVQ